MTLVPELARQLYNFSHQCSSMMMILDSHKKIREKIIEESLVLHTTKKYVITVHKYTGAHPIPVDFHDKQYCLAIAIEGRIASPSWKNYGVVGVFSKNFEESSSIRCSRETLVLSLCTDEII